MRPSLNLNVQRPIIILLCGTAVGVAVISALAMYFRRRKRRKAKLYSDIVDEPVAVAQQSSANFVEKVRTPSSSSSTDRLNKNRNNKNLSSKVHSMPMKALTLKESYEHTHSSQHSSPANTIRKSNSVASDLSDMNSTGTTVLANDNPSAMSAPQLLEAGVDLILKARHQWELALHQLNRGKIGDDEDEDDVNIGFDDEDVLKLSSSEEETANRLRQQLMQLLDLADRMRSCCSNEMLSHLCAGVAMNAALSEMDREYEERRKKYISDDSSSEVESFYSAVETVDLSDLEEHIEQFQHLLLYEDALQQLQDGNVPYRTLRTKQMGCSSDTEFLAKVHCIRQAFTDMFHGDENRKWFEDIGRDLVGLLLKHADKEPADFYKAYDNLMDYLKDGENWVSIESELKERNVKVMTFFDIVIDFLLFDAFDDLDNVPSAIINVCANRWITNGFKETAILTFVWSVLKAKRAMLSQPNGFMSRFYSISEITSPVLAWGFLGPDGPLKNMCQFFKNQVVDYMTEVFSFDFVRFNTLTELTEDITRLTRKHGQVARDKLSIHPSNWTS